jgi:hypothetical protein
VATTFVLIVLFSAGREHTFGLGAVAVSFPDTISCEEFVKAIPPTELRQMYGASPNSKIAHICLPIVEGPGTHRTPH